MGCLEETLRRRSDGVASPQLSAFEAGGDIRWINVAQGLARGCQVPNSGVAGSIASSPRVPKMSPHTRGGIAAPARKRVGHLPLHDADFQSHRLQPCRVAES